MTADKKISQKKTVNPQVQMHRITSAIAATKYAFSTSLRKADRLVTRQLSMMSVCVIWGNSVVADISLMRVFLLILLMSCPLHSVLIVLHRIP